MKQLVSFGKIAACAAMVLGFSAVGSAADWTFYAANEEGNPDANKRKCISDGEWIVSIWSVDALAHTLSIGAGGESLSIFKGSGDLNLAKPIFSSDGTAWTLTKIENRSMRTNNLKSILLPTTLTWIDDYAFEGVSSITNITFPVGNELKKVGGGAFNGGSTIADGVAAGWDFSALETLGAFNFNVKAEKLVFPVLSSVGGRCFNGGGLKVDEYWFLSPALAKLTNYTFEWSPTKRFVFGTDVGSGFTAEIATFNGAGSITNATFLGRVPSTGLLDALLYAISSDCAENFTVSPFNAGGWEEIVEPTDEEGAFGIYSARTGNKGRKARVSWSTELDDLSSGILVVATEPYGCTAVPTPATGRYSGYASGDSFSATAPESGTFDGSPYAISGWRVDEWRDGVWTESSQKGSGSAANFTYAGVPSRLVWIYSETGKALTLVGVNEGEVTVSPEPLSKEGNVYNYATDQQVTLTATDSPETSPRTWFRRWTGDLDGVTDPTAKTITFAMSDNRSVSAKFKREWTYDPSSRQVTDGEWTLNTTLAEDGESLTVTSPASYTGSSGELDLSVSIAGGYQFVAIGNNAFYVSSSGSVSKNLTSVILPATVHTIGSRAFWCNDASSGYNLVNFQVLGDGLRTIGDQAFACWSGTINATNNFAEIVPPGVTHIGSSAFSCSTDHAALKYVVGGLTLTNVQSIGSFAFGNLPISFVDIASPTLTTISSRAFWQQQAGAPIKLVRLDLPELTTIESQAFASWGTALAVTNLYVGAKNLTTVSGDAFGLNSNLKDITFEGAADRAAADNVLAGIPAMSGSYALNIYVSKKQGAWKANARALTEDEKAVSPAKCFGVYQTANGTDKGWLIHRASKWDPTGMMLLFR